MKWKNSIKLWWLMILNGMFSMENNNYDGYKSKLTKIAVGSLIFFNKQAEGLINDLNGRNLQISSNDIRFNDDLAAYDSSTYYNVDGTVCSMINPISTTFNHQSADIFKYFANVNTAYTSTTGLGTIGSTVSANNCGININMNDKYYGFICAKRGIDIFTTCNPNNLRVNSPLLWNEYSPLTRLVPGSTLTKNNVKCGKILNAASKTAGTTSTKSVSTYTTPVATGDMHRIKFLTNDNLSGEISAGSVITYEAPRNGAFQIEGITNDENSNYLGKLCYIVSPTHNANSVINGLSTDVEIIKDNNNNNLNLRYVPPFNQREKFRSRIAPYNYSDTVISVDGTNDIGESRIFSFINNNQTNSVIDFIFSRHTITNSPAVGSTPAVTVEDTDSSIEYNGIENRKKLTLRNSIEDLLRLNVNPKVGLNIDYKVENSVSQDKELFINNTHPDGLIRSAKYFYNTTGNTTLPINSFVMRTNNEKDVKIVINDKHFLITESDVSLSKNKEFIPSSQQLNMIKNRISNNLFNKSPYFKSSYTDNNQKSYLFYLTPSLSVEEITEFFMEEIREKVIIAYLSGSLNIPADNLSKYDWNYILNDIRVNSISGQDNFDGIMRVLFNGDVNNIKNLSRTTIVKIKFLDESIKTSVGNIIEIIKNFALGFADKNFIINEEILQRISRDLDARSRFGQIFNPNFKRYTNSFLNNGINPTQTDLDNQFKKYFGDNFKNDVVFQKYFNFDPTNSSTQWYVLALSEFIQDISVGFINFVHHNQFPSTDGNQLKNFLINNLFNKIQKNILVIADINVKNSQLNMFRINTNQFVSDSIPNVELTLYKDVRNEIESYFDNYRKKDIFQDIDSNLSNDILNSFKNLIGYFKNLNFNDSEGIILHGFFIDKLVKLFKYLDGGNSVYNSNQNEYSINRREYTIYDQYSSFSNARKKDFYDNDENTLKLNSNFAKIKSVLNKFFDKECFEIKNNFDSLFLANKIFEFICYGSKNQDNDRVFYENIKELTLLINKTLNDIYSFADEEQLDFVIEEYKNKISNNMHNNTKIQEEIIDYIQLKKGFNLDSLLIAQVINTLKNFNLENNKTISNVNNFILSLDPIISTIHIPFAKNQKLLIQIKDLQFYYAYLKEYILNNLTKTHIFNHDIINNSLKNNRYNLLSMVYNNPLNPSIKKITYLDLINDVVDNNYRDDSLVTLRFNNNFLFIENNLKNFNSSVSLLTNTTDIQSLLLSGISNSFSNSISLKRNLGTIENILSQGLSSLYIIVNQFVSSLIGLNKNNFKDILNIIKVILDGVEFSVEQLKLLNEALIEFQNNGNQSTLEQSFALILSNLNVVNLINNLINGKRILQQNNGTFNLLEPINLNIQNLNWCIFNGLLVSQDSINTIYYIFYGLGSVLIIASLNPIKTYLKDIIFKCIKSYKKWKKEKEKENPGFIMRYCFGNTYNDFKANDKRRREHFNRSEATQSAGLFAVSLIGYLAVEKFNDCNFVNLPNSQYLLAGLIIQATQLGLLTLNSMESFRHSLVSHGARFASSAANFGMGVALLHGAVNPVAE